MVRFPAEYVFGDSESLLLQFYRLANIYFLIVGVLQTIPAISPLGPLTAWAPLIVVLGISMIREGISIATQDTKITSGTSQTSNSTTSSPLKFFAMENSSTSNGVRS
jgi:hypothetical protein